MWLRSVALLMVLGISACTWVELSPEGEQVRVTTMNAVSGCQRVGKTTVNTLPKIAGLPRHEESMQDELNKLARNSARDLGGDTIVPITPIEEGEQVFAVFRCNGGR